MQKKPTEQSELAYWLALWRGPNVRATLFNRLRCQKTTVKDIFLAGPSFWATLNLPNALQHYLCKPDWKGVEKDLQWAEQSNCHIVQITDANYPLLLKEIADPPPLLFVQGSPGVLTSLQIAIVGSRQASLPGKEFTHELAYCLSKVTCSVTSGLAKGIDAAAHRGCLEAGGPTIAVFGTGVNHIYPKNHARLAAHICEKGGALVSEFPTYVSPCRHHFPQRNRIISGLSIGTVVVEATIKSGSLITARLAASQGREVFAVPGGVGHPLTRGTHHLIREGAKLTEGVTDILEELLPSIRAQLERNQKKDKNVFALDKLDREEFKLLKCVGFQPTEINTVINRSHLSAAKVAVGLLDLELKGYICAVTSNIYVRKNIAGLM